MKIGKALETARKTKGVSQKELAAKINITQSYLSLIESDKKNPNLNILKEIASALDVPLPFILIDALDEDDIPDEKKASFKVIMPFINSLFTEYNKQ